MDRRARLQPSNPSSQNTPKHRSPAGPFLFGGVGGFDSKPSFDKARSAAGRRSEAKAPRRGEPKANHKPPQATQNIGAKRRWPEGRGFS
ncbi:MAG: hypothetical protein KZQ93_13405 [Candidatus Thiodiazotropha sp. (ex Monitilora ramsayi)]|nr:hypothetical protein [Candidatus Thiodiazotropha sp. (ex Monitilora ramsayi)]